MIKNESINLECVQWLAQRRNSAIRVSGVEAPFNSAGLILFRTYLLAQVKASHGFALIGLSVPSTKIQTNKIRGRVLAESGRSPTFQPARDIGNMMEFLESNLGISLKDIYRRPELLNSNDNPSKSVLNPLVYHNQYHKNKFLLLPADTMIEKCKEFRQTDAALSQTGKHIKIKN